jgi:hypothetical protein
MCSAAPVRAANLWYNGNFDGTDATTNQKVPINTGSGYVFDTALVFDDFVVPAGHTWTVSSLYSYDQVSYYTAPTTATWQIRSGVSAGNGGTLVASGDSTATITAGHAADYVNYLYPEDKVAETISGVTLTAGTYWMAIAPDSAGYYGDQSYIETTSGANAIGLPAGNDASSFELETGGLDPKNFVVADYADYSAGVDGTDALASPEPTTALLLAAATAPALVVRRRRRPR